MNLEFQNLFCGNPLDRKSHVRSKVQRSSQSKCILFFKDQILLSEIVNDERSKDQNNEQNGKIQYKIAWNAGVQTSQISHQVFLGEDPFEKEELWAVHLISDKGYDTHLDSDTTAKTYFQPMRPGAFGLSKQESAMVAQARALVDWAIRYIYCPSCASKTEVTEAGWKLSCKNETCISHKGIQNFSYPRTDAAVIMCILSEDGKECLLGRQSRWPAKMYSCLAGFVEPGESLEEAVRREVKEEAGIEIGKVVYHSSQPWPFPSQLMLGCIAYAKSRQVVLVDKELEDARWFDIVSLQQMIQRSHPEGFFSPPGYAIAHQLVKHVCMNNKL